VTTLPKPYYDQDGITIYHADCRDILPLLPKVDLVLTDPPYPDYNKDHGKNWECPDIDWDAEEYGLKEVRQFIFWPPDRWFIPEYSACHVWHKPNGQSNLHYEFIYERWGQSVYRVFRIPIINYSTLPEWEPHPTQKPVKLIHEIIQRTKAETILDPFMGSGTTLVAAKHLGRKAIGIEIEERYCAIAVKRLGQGVLAL
jgi:DNA modification methylase